MNQTSLFFLISFLLFTGIWFVGYHIPKLLIIFVYLAYVIFCIKSFKNIKMRFLAYPSILANLFFGWYFYEASGLSDANVVGLGYVMIFGFIFVILPLMSVAFTIGVVFDIIELTQKNKQ